MSATDEHRQVDRRTTRVVTSEMGLWTRIVEMWRGRELLFFMVGRDLTVKYKNSILGMLWSLLNPALMLAIFVFVFQIVMQTSMPGYAIYLMCGLVVWNFFSSAVSQGCGAVVGNGHLIKKISFPREILALTAMGTSAVFWFFQVIILVAVLVIFRYVPQSPYVFLIPMALLALLMFTAALSIFFSAVNVYFRDTQHLLEIALLAWFWGTPIVYNWSTIGPKLSQHHLTWLYLANPIAPIVLLMQRALWGNKMAIVTSPAVGNRPAIPKDVPLVAQFSTMWYVEVFSVIIAVSAVLFLLALRLFGRLEGNFAEEL